MDAFKPYAVFAEAVAAGSMSAAARRLRMSPSAVSQTIRELERQAGVTLLHRTTRKLALTEAGQRCYPHCLRLVEAARAAREAIDHARDAPTGELRVAAPVGFASHIASALAPLLAEAPTLRLQVLLDDAMIDLVDARIDLAVRVGQLADSNWVARPLCAFEVALCASPAYIERHGLPASPDAFADHQWLGFGRESDDATLPTIAIELVGPGGERRRVEVGVRIASNNQVALQQMCEEGLGIARLALADVGPVLARGALVRVLPQWRFAPMPVVAVTPSRDGDPAKVRVAIEALRRYFAALPGLAVEA